MARHPMIEDISFMVNSGPGEPLAETRERIEFLATEVLPQVRRNIGG